MARVPRSRSRSKLVNTDTRKGTWNSLPVNETYNVLNADSCNDYIGRPVEDSPLSISTRDRSGFVPYHGTAVASTGSGKVEHTNSMPAWQRNWSQPHLSTGAPSSSGQGPTIRSRTNPSRPTIVPFTLVQDLYDIPRLLKGVGRLIRTPRRFLSPREQANQYLGAKFGWLPLIDDANKLLHVGLYIDKRKSEIDRLYSGKGLKRRIQLGEGNTHSQANFSTWESNAWFSPNYGGRVSTTTNERVWGTCRWKPTSSPGHNPTDRQKLQLAIQTVSGLTTEGVVKGAWDLLPWSWMVDWFSNVGDWLTQSSSTIPAIPVSTCVMRQQTTFGEGQVTQRPGWLEGGGGTGVFITKSRSVQGGSLNAHLPTLDGDRLSVLAALFVQRFKRR